MMGKLVASSAQMYASFFRDLTRHQSCFRLFVRSLSTSTTSSSSRSSGGGHSGPISLKATPRGAKAAKVRSKASFANGKLSGSNGLNSQKGHLHNNGSVSTAIHPVNSYIYGDMPCDPPTPPFQLAKYGEESLHTLVLLRHGESEWNAQNRYTGWCDVSLTKNGELEARAAGRLLHENKIEIDHAFTSLLKRASFSCNMALNTAQQHWVPITKTWRLNERHYGALQGYNKDTAYEELSLDQELVMQMRRSYDVRPPRMDDEHEYWHGNDRR